MYAVYRTTNTIILYLILSTISIFIPVSGGVGRGQVHCFAQGGGGGGGGNFTSILNNYFIMLNLIKKHIYTYS